MIIAEHLAFKTEDFLSMLTILKWKRELYIVENIGGKIKNYHANIYIKEKEYLNCYTNLVEYKNIYITIFSYTLIQAEKIEKSTLDNLLTIKNNKLIKSEKYALSQTAKLLFHKINCDIYFLLKDWKKNYYHNKQQLNIVKSGCFSPKEVLRAYGNMAIPLKKLSLNKEFELIKDELFNYYNKQPNHIKSFDVENQFIVFMNNYVSYQLVNNTKNGIKIGVLLNNIIEKSTLISSKLVFYVNMSIAYFFEQNFKQALSFSTKILMNEKSHFRKDIISFTMIMASVLYYELEDFDLMLYQINHFLNHFNSEENKDEAALIFLNYLKTVGKEGAINSQLKNQQLLALKYKILPFDIKNNEMSFDIICWIDSKLQNRTFHEQLITSKLNIIKIIDMH